VTQFPFCVLLTSMVHEAALPKAKQHGTKAAKSKQEEMLKQALAEAEKQALAEKAAAAEKEKF